MLEVLEAVGAVWGSRCVGLRISPLNSYNSMLDSRPIELSIWLAKRLNQFNLAYLHVMRGDFFQQQTGDILTPIRQNYNGVLIGNMGYSPQEADQAVKTGQVDAVAFGVSFLANPDLPARIEAGAALNEPDAATFYTSGPEGYVDYPTLIPS